MEHVVLYAAESVLSFFVENLLHGLAHPAFDVPVEVVERHAQHFGKGVSDGGFAGSHVAYENDSCHFFLAVAPRRLVVAGVAFTISMHCS